MNADLNTFEAHRRALFTLAYRMLGEVAAAEDLVQEAWLRWQQRQQSKIDEPRAYLMRVVTNLCLNELSSARARSEEARSDRLPEPIDVSEMGQLEAREQISMAFLVLLQRLTAAERAVFILHEVFEYSHSEVGAMIGRSEPGCRQLLLRARDSIADDSKRYLTTSKSEHRRLLSAFAQAAQGSRVEELTQLLANDATLIADGGPDGALFGRVRKLPGPLVGSTRVATFVSALMAQGPRDLEAHECELNQQPALLIGLHGAAVAAIMIAVADGRVHHVFVHADPKRLGHTRMPAQHRMNA